MAANDDLEDDRRAFRNQHLVAEVLGFDLEVGNRAGATFPAVEAKLVVVGGTAFRVLETVRQQEEPALEVDGLHLLAPEFVADADHREAEVLLAQAEVLQQVLAHFLKRGSHQGLGAVERLAELFGGFANAIAGFARFRHGFEMSGARSLVLLGFDSGRHWRILRKRFLGEQSASAGRCPGGERACAARVRAPPP